MRLRTGSLFSGYGGLDLAVNAFYGSDTAWHVEYEAAPSKILAHHWPDIPNHGDVTRIDWTTIEPIDILTGGYPCQPFSAAGRRQGTKDERHLWPYVREAIRHLRPRLTILENVAGHRSLGFDRVLGDLAEDGLDAQWVSVRASDVGAPHRRERIFILVADPEGVRSQGGRRPGRGRPQHAELGGGVALLPNADRIGHQERHERAERSATQEPGTDGGGQALSDAHSIGWHRRGPTPGEAQGAHLATDRHGTGVEWGAYAPAVRRWERVTRPAPAPTELNSNGRPRLNAAFAEWMMGLPEGHVTAVPGLSRAEQLKAIGNGVCPPQAYRALELLHHIAFLESAS